MHDRIALGTVQFGQTYGIANENGKPGLEQMRSILEVAAANGIYCLDTAMAYGDSEQCLGKVGVNAFAVTSKLPPLPCDKEHEVSAWVDAQVDASLERLGLERLDGLLLHRPEQLFTPVGPELYRALREQVSRGIVKRIGVSIYDPSEMDQLIPRFDLDVVQVPMNILDARFAESGWIKRLQEADIALHVRSIFLQGLLLMPAHKRPAYFDHWALLWDAWSKWLADHQLTPLQACLRYALHTEGVEQVVLGVDNVAQLSEILAVAGEGLLPDGYQSLQMHDVRLLNPSLWTVK